MDFILYFWKSNKTLASDNTWLCVSFSVMVNGRKYLMLVCFKLYTHILINISSTLEEKFQHFKSIAFTIYYNHSHSVSWAENFSWNSLQTLIKFFCTYLSYLNKIVETFDESDIWHRLMRFTLSLIQWVNWTYVSNWYRKVWCTL